ncbi:hypothetical protein [Actinomadura sp. CNU-125]|uniref:hypothetical protein n=1 Tax=Actinomadura sp. CNU-125 TaxID=1904961 RepID=UPI0021CCF5BF|nr:hypothetical protein [Actinomadura sp. CNU-125]
MGLFTHGIGLATVGGAPGAVDPRAFARPGVRHDRPGNRPRGSGPGTDPRSEPRSEPSDAAGRVKGRPERSADNAARNAAENAADHDHRHRAGCEGATHDLAEPATTDRAAGPAAHREGTGRAGPAGPGLGDPRHRFAPAGAAGPQRGGVALAGPGSRLDRAPHRDPRTPRRRAAGGVLGPGRAGRPPRHGRRRDPPGRRRPDRARHLHARRVRPVHRLPRPGAAGRPQRRRVDVAAACTGFVYGLQAAVGWLATQRGAPPCALVIGVEVYSKFLDPADRGTAALFGDGAAAAVVGPVPLPYGIGPVTLGSDAPGPVTC